MTEASCMTAGEPQAFKNAQLPESVAPTPCWVPAEIPGLEGILRVTAVMSLPLCPARLAFLDTPCTKVPHPLQRQDSHCGL